MDTNTDLIATAERLFHEHGFMATSMDNLARAARMSSRTLYKHAGSKTALAVRVLEARDRRFLDQVQGREVSALFAALQAWNAVNGAHGCLFLRLLGETGGAQPDIAAAVHAHKARVRRLVETMVDSGIGRVDTVLADRIVLLFEGAAAASVYQGDAAIVAAASAAADLMAGAGQPRGAP